MKRGRGQGGAPLPPPPSPQFSGAKSFFPRKIGNHKIFTGEEYVRLEFIY